MLMFRFIVKDEKIGGIAGFHTMQAADAYKQLVMMHDESGLVLSVVDQEEEIKAVQAILEQYKAVTPSE